MKKRKIYPPNRIRTSDLRISDVSQLQSSALPTELSVAMLQSWTNRLSIADNIVPATQNMVSKFQITFNCKTENFFSKSSYISRSAFILAVRAWSNIRHCQKTVWWATNQICIFVPRDSRRRVTSYVAIKSDVLAYFGCVFCSWSARNFWGIWKSTTVRLM